ncbi:leucyl aminopeptidase family protein [Shimia sp. CNT1-13L.2]|uniref:leucyl aminopeptidase family protein n=1 Tax=Shimia sp. CNT1-13L.2 TaxID=2959663 RepID=UPI0020CF2D40|nr:leucyl aminopeptidase family protein [Shimia sp. CNT1-13L.2]MCP9482965.1 leucyl aminopeptidase family protein [Shimia sp. CNT1-13L.2]
MTLSFAPASSDTLPLHIVDKDSFDTWREAQSDATRSWLDATGFKPAVGATALIPGTDGTPVMALAGYGDAKARARGRFPLAAAAKSLPEGTYHLTSDLPAGDLETECLGWLLSAYAFDRYAKQSGAKARLTCPKGVDAARVEAIANAEALTRDLINTPAADMGPDALEAACRDLAETFDATVAVTTGEALLDNNLPMIHAVGRAAAKAPRLIDMHWGDTGPKLTLVGKGVCFDTGGLNLKPGGSMALMKKDMGGAATVLGLARMIMALNLPLQLRVLIPAVENAVSGNAFRPGDILTSRKGLTVEINNTDAEGRLVLADALALADEDTPDTIISMATLTGAARVAVGPDLSPFYTDDNATAAALAKAATNVSDPVWRMPFWEPYEKMIEPGIADLDNAPSGGFAGSITAALFLRRFVDNARYTHFDIYGWNPASAPARPKGGVGMGARALLDALPDMLGL